LYLVGVVKWVNPVRLGFVKNEPGQVGLTRQVEMGQ